MLLPMKTQKKFPKLYLSFLLGFVLFNVQILTAQTSANQGYLRIIDVEGDVSIVHNTSNATINAEENTSFTEGHTVHTGSDSSIILILSNGATLFIGPNSIINIETFELTPNSESAELSRRPLNELEHEIGVSNISVQILRGTVYLDTQPMSEGSSIALRDENVTTYPSTDGGAYSQHFHRERGRSIVEVVQGNVATKATNEMTSIMRDTGIYHFERGNVADTLEEPFEESFITVAFLQRLNQARQSSASGDHHDMNNIQDANDRTFTNPITGDEVFPPSNQENPSDDIISVIE